MVERKRHLAKAVSYRCFGSLGTVVIAYIATGNVALGFSIGAVETVAKIGVYYLHERVWYRIKWGIRTGPGAPAAVSARPSEAMPSYGQPAP